MSNNISIEITNAITEYKNQVSHMYNLIHICDHYINLEGIEKAIKASYIVSLITTKFTDTLHLYNTILDKTISYNIKDEHINEFILEAEKHNSTISKYLDKVHITLSNRELSTEKGKTTNGQINQNDSNKDSTIEGIENDLYNFINEELRNNSTIVKAEIEHTIQVLKNNLIKTELELYKHHISNHNTDSFLDYLKLKQNISNSKRNLFIKEKELTLLKEDLKYIKLDQYFSKLGILFLRTSLVESEKKSDIAKVLPIAIIAEVADCFMDINMIQDRITLLEDFKNIHKLIRKDNYSKLIFMCDKRNKIEFNNNSILTHIASTLEHIALKNFSGGIKELNNELKVLELKKKKNLHIIIKRIANVLIDYGVMTNISSKGNKYNLFNKEGRPIGLHRKDAELIFNILETLELKLTYSKGEDKNKDILHYDKFQFIKERLETANTIDQDYKYEKKPNIILELT